VWSDVLKRKLKPPKPKLCVNAPKKNIPKDLMAEGKEPNNNILGWSFAEEED